jgi:hypothetical protein
MELSQAAQWMTGIILITVPTVQFGGTFLLSELVKPTVIKSTMQAAFFRAGHAHAGVLVLLALIAQILIDSITWSETASWLLRTGFAISPILVSAGFFVSMIGAEEKPNRLIALIYLGAGILALSLIALGIALIL